MRLGPSAGHIPPRAVHGWATALSQIGALFTPDCLVWAICLEDNLMAREIMLLNDGHCIGRQELVWRTRYKRATSVCKGRIEKNLTRGEQYEEEEEATEASSEIS